MVAPTESLRGREGERETKRTGGVCFVEGGEERDREEE